MNSGFSIHRLIRNTQKIQPLGIECDDWVAVREAYKQRGRSENEQLIVIFGGLIWAIERADGDGFAMAHQDSQSEEDHYWYPDWEREPTYLEALNISDEAQREKSLRRFRITCRPAVMGGKPTIRGMPVTVEMIVGMIKSGDSREKILLTYPDLEDEDITAALEYSDEQR